ncbi:MAG: glycosyltransferase family 4 protein [Anaerolineae bacterium]
MRAGLLTADLNGHHGWARYGAEVAAALRTQGAQLTLVCPINTDPAAYPDALRLLPTVAPLQRGMLARQLALVPALRRALAHCDVIHNTVELYAPLAWLVAGHRPLVHTLHGTYANLPRMRRWPLSALYRRAFTAGRAVCVSQYTACVASEVMPELRARVIPNAVDAARFAVDGPPLAAREPIILATGGVKARKGTLALVRALAVVREAVPAARLVVVGRAPTDGYGQAVREAIHALGLADAVTLTGFVDEAELRQWYGRARVFALPSIAQGHHFEGFGLVQLEASAAGLPVVTTTGSGAAEAVEDGVTGFVVDAAQLDHALPAALIRLLTDDALAQRMGSAGILKAQRTTWADVARQLLQVYELPR